MSIITREINKQREQDPSYINPDLQWAWGRGYTCGSTRPPTTQETDAMARELFTIEHTGQYRDSDQAWRQLDDADRHEYHATIRRLLDAAHHTASRPDPQDSPASYELTLTRNDGQTVTIGNIRPIGERALFTPSSEAVRDDPLTLRILAIAAKAIKRQRRKHA